MALPGSLHLSPGLGFCRNQDSYFNNQPPVSVSCMQHLPCRRHKLERLSVLNADLSSRISFLKQDRWGVQFFYSLCKPSCTVPGKVSAFRCHSSLVPGQPGEFTLFKTVSTVLARSSTGLQSSPVILNLVPAVGIIIFTVWGIGPLLCHSRGLFLNEPDNNWEKSGTYHVLTSYIRPMLLWTGAILICRALDPMVLPTEASKMVKQRVLNFVRSLSTVLAFAYCLSSVIRKAQNFLMETSDSKDPRNMGFQFAGKALYSAVWVASLLLFMELLGFSTQKWVTAGGLGTVLLTLAGREIFTNFLSSAMIHATRPFVVNEWIQTKIEGYEVSGTVEHVGWWSPTIVRGEDREAVHIPNHKFTVNVVRNLTQKTHWRIKTHLAISHLDVNKINIIVADMRKVLAKNPQVEQKRLHRRVFLDIVNPENQGLLIMVSCFVKTPHFEEYLRVKETILLDLLKVISHHGARLATPIRTMYKMYSDTDSESTSNADPELKRSGPVSNRPLLMLEPPRQRVNGEDRKNQSQSMRTDGEQDVQTTMRSKSDSKKDDKVGASSLTNYETASKFKADSNTDLTSHSQSVEEITTKEGSRSDHVVSQVAALKSNSSSTSKKNLDVSDGIILESATGTAPDVSTQKTSVSKPSNGHAGGTSRDSDSDRLISSSPNSADKLRKSSQEDEKKTVLSPPTSRTPMEENIVLDVALSGSKKTLPIEEEMDSPPGSEEARGVTTRGSGNGPSAAETDRINKRSVI